MDPETLSRLATLLGLAPAEGEESVSIDAVFAKIEELLSQAAELEALKGETGDAATRLQELQTQFDQVRGELEAKSQELDALYRAKTEAEVDGILEQFADRLTDEKMKARIRALLLSDRESGMDILNGLPQPAAKANQKEPPEPVHNPAAEQEKEMSTEQKLAAQNAFVAQIRKEVRDGRTPFASYDAALAEARRRKPELFA